MFGVVCPAVIVGTGGLRVRSSTLLRLEGLEEDSATKLGHWAQDSHLMLPVLNKVNVDRSLLGGSSWIEMWCWSWMLDRAHPE